LQALGVAALERQVVALHAQHVHVAGAALEDAAEELQLEVELALVRRANRRAGGAGRLRAFRRVLVLVCHDFPLRKRFASEESAGPRSSADPRNAHAASPGVASRRLPPAVLWLRPGGRWCRSVFVIITAFRGSAKHPCGPAPRARGRAADAGAWED